MAIQYSGSPYMTTFVNSAGTQQEIVTGLQTALTTAGWSVISGSGTSNVLMQSATTPASGSLNCRVNFIAPGSGNCSQVKFRNAAGTKIQTNYHPLFPLAGKTWRVIANPYQFFIFSTNSLSAGREFCAGGVPYLPTFLQGVITECIWSDGNGNSDTLTGVYSSFRTALTTGTQNAQGTTWVDVNLNMWENFNFVANNQYGGWPQLMSQIGSQINPSTAAIPPSYRWHDYSVLVYEPLLAWGLTSYTDEGLIRGQMWDAAIVSDSYAADITTTFDTHNWWNLTGTNTGTGGTYSRGSLFLVTS